MIILIQIQPIFFDSLAKIIRESKWKIAWFIAVCLLYFFYVVVVAGAQCRPEEGVNPKEMINQLETKYKSIQKEWPTENENLHTVYLDWLGGKSTDKADHMLYTEYHEVEKMTNSLAIKW